MADVVRILRVSMGQNSAKQVGLRVDQPTTTSANQKTRGHASDIYAMPADGDNWQPLQDLDPTSSTFGSFFFLPGYSIPGGPDIVR